MLSLRQNAERKKAWQSSVAGRAVSADVGKGALRGFTGSIKVVSVKK